mgnify:CR=1 FL=1
MKFLLMLVPVLMLLVFMRLGSGVLASGSANPVVLIAVAFLLLFLLVLLKPKNKSGKPASDLEKKARGEFAKDAFADPKLAAMFQAAMKDYSGSMPKAALNKLTKLAALCTDEKDIYAVSLATAQCLLVNGKPLPAIREYNRALTIHPTAEVALELGSCHQRLGNLEKARDSYEFALDLEEENLEALSRIATTYVADHEFDTALEYANRIIDVEENHASALATAAICHGVLGDPVLCAYYTNQAVDNGYSKKKIEETIAVLRKKVK